MAGALSHARRQCGLYVVTLFRRTNSRYTHTHPQTGSHAPHVNTDRIRWMEWLPAVRPRCFVTTFTRRGGGGRQGGPGGPYGGWFT